MYKIGWFSTGRDKAARDLLRVVQNSIQQRGIKARVCFVFSNREAGEYRESDLFFRLVRRYQIPLIWLSHRQFKALGGDNADWRKEYDREVQKLLLSFSPDLCVLAGYMLIVGEELCQKYNMVNLHPAAPGGPSGTWQEVIWKLMESKAHQYGIMMHLVTPELDRGPVVAYSTFSLRGRPFDRRWKEIEGRSVAELKAEEGESHPLFRLIRREGLRREFPLIVATLKALADGRIKIVSGKVTDAQGKAITGYNLTAEVG